MYRYSMKRITALRASSRVRHFLRLYMLFLSVAKNDSATALSRQLPVRPTDSLTPCSSAQRARSLDVYCEPLSPLSRCRLSADYAEEIAKPQTGRNRCRRQKNAA